MQLDPLATVISLYGWLLTPYDWPAGLHRLNCYYAWLIDLVSQWMSANLLSLNQSKTEFLLIGLPAQISKISDPSLRMPSNVTITPA